MGIFQLHYNGTTIIYAVCHFPECCYMACEYKLKVQPYQLYLKVVCFFKFFQEAINLLEPMTNDPVNYVRQGALIASALIMIQQTEITCPKVSKQRNSLEERWFGLFFSNLSSFEDIF